MSRRKLTTMSDDVPASVPVAVKPLTEESGDIWARWARDREARQIQRKINAEMEAREAASLPIYPRECAERIAQDTKDVAPDWRTIRPTIGPAWGRLLKAQPELSRELSEQREATITAVFNTVPRHLRATVNDLRALIDLLLMAHEAAAYQVGYEGGKLAAKPAHVEYQRTRKRHTSRDTQAEASGLRLTDGAK